MRVVLRILLIRRELKPKFACFLKKFEVKIRDCSGEEILILALKP